ncbi:glycine--tRNA ligase subunit beta [Caldovatus aquaticus]|uniref:Glycine--tRNA ligase beta subunit n=1 Tax=Caldovatus aquaticus TaxID=2865671 RepID=A0ABS7F582_9PROT|nr:glycine--tRNA ligase subunit beta [Caldovatus aquaticus]MBW8270719.1 glycine--tRNA ligase subunit beta [Caldovatus aquaticus]
MAELLLELLSEEIPARMQARAAEDLKRLLGAEIAPLLAGREPRVSHGPRRLALVAEVEPAVETPGREERGPRVGAPEQAIEGFLRKHGATRAALRQEGAFWVLSRPGERIEARALVARAVPAVLRAFPWPKSMRWGRGGGFAWVRPLKRILCLLDGAVVPFDLRQGDDDAHGLRSGDETEGHRIMAPGAFAVRSAAEYVEGLRARKVIVEAEERARIIREGVARLAAAEGFEVVPDEGLLAEVAGLVEWPVPLLGRIDDAFMDLPPEVLRTTMRVNQRYFALRTPEGRAAPRFALVANVAARDGGAAIVAGNERVLRARLADARFFWDQDRKERLESRLPKLDGVVFHAGLGSLGERVRRLERLARIIALHVGADPALAARAARLAKADLASGMVGEFPELQGVMGRYYALHDGEDARVAEAIAAHYRPVGPNDAVPDEPVAIAVALADKLDQLVGFFAIGEKPTGSGDPFALRRAALGVIRIVRENGLRLPLFPILEAARRGIERSLEEARRERERAAGRERAVIVVPNPDHEILREVRPETVEVYDFLTERLRVQLRAEGMRHDVVSAVLGVVRDDDLNRLLRRADAVRRFLESEDGANLLVAYRRAANILRIEERKDGHAYDTGYERHLLKAPEEEALAEALETAARRVELDLEAEDFERAMDNLAALRAPVDAFFDRVTVNDPAPELRRNRLRLLARLRAVMDAVADFSRIEG